MSAPREVAKFFPRSATNVRRAIERMVCADSHAHCSSWAAAGECKTNLDFMLTTCRLSCAMCGNGPKPHTWDELNAADMGRPDGKANDVRPNFSAADASTSAAAAAEADAELFEVDYGACAFVLFIAVLWLLALHSRQRAARDALVQLLVAIACLMGSINNHRLISRASHVCNADYYVARAFAYPVRSASHLLWLKLSVRERARAGASPPMRDKRYASTAALAVAAHMVANACIAIGAAWCFFKGIGVDKCPPSGAAGGRQCDHIVRLGESVYFVAWLATSALSAHAAHLPGGADRIPNLAQTALTLPVHIMLLLAIGGATSSQRSWVATHTASVISSQLTMAYLSHRRLRAWNDQRSSEVQPKHTITRREEKID